MSYSLTQLLLIIVAYLSGLFAVAYCADRGWIPRRITHHPATYVLSLAVFAGAMASNGVFELAYRHGYSFQLYYLGIVLVFLLGAILLMPLLRLCRVYQLASVADLLTFRFRSQLVGASVTIAMCITLLPLLAMQIQAVADSIHILSGDTAFLLTGTGRNDGLALIFCVIITAFSILFGTRHNAFQKRNTGLVTAIAFESLVKLAALLGLMWVAVNQGLGGLDGMTEWLQYSDRAGTVLDQPMEVKTARSLLLLFFAGTVCMPHLFHMAFAENTDSRDLHTATWGMPLYLLLLSLPVIPILAVSLKLGHELPMEYSGLAVGLGLNSNAATMAAFVAGLSAASATIIVTTLALANMCLNHLLLPGNVLQLDQELRFHGRLRRLRRILITVLILAGYALFLALRSRDTLVQAGLASFVGVLQFMPGIVATLYWPGANRKGLLAGLGAGLGIWFVTLLLPLVSSLSPDIYRGPFSELLVARGETWAWASLLSLSVNAGLFIIVSLISRAEGEERVAAEICSMDNLSRPVRQRLTLHSADQFSDHLAPALGERTARSEVKRALRELRFEENETRPYALRRLRSRIEANLSGLLGPAVAHNIVNRCIPFEHSTLAGSEDINLIERNLDRAQLRLSGLAADLDNLRRHYRSILENLPIGVLSVGSDGEVLMWNNSMETLTGIDSELVLGSHLSALPQPWHDIIENLLEGEAESAVKREVETASGSSRWLSLQKANPAAQAANSDDRVLLVEDITQFELLEEELIHNERLASIGRLAAGVAHEIGNPVTGIACLAQNLEYEHDPIEVRNTAEDILKQTERVTRIVESLVNFSHIGSSSEATELRACNLADCVDEAIHLLRLDSSARPVEFDNRCDREWLVLADSQRLLQVFINLLGNARDACDEGGSISISATLGTDRVGITVEDNGCGITPQALGRVFEPFYTSKEPGEGTGLGLALVYSIMEDMGGTVSLDSPISDSGGTRVTLQLGRASYPEQPDG